MSGRSLVGFFPMVRQIGVRVVHAVLQLPQGSVVIMQSLPAANFHRIMRGGDVFRQRIRVGDGFLPRPDGIHIGAIVHAPNRLGAKLANVKFQVGRLEVATPAGQKVLQVLAIVRLELLAEHIVLALMPHETFDPVSHFPPVQFGQGGLNQLQCQRVELIATWVIGIPISAQCRSTGGALDDGDGGLDFLQTRSGKPSSGPTRLPRGCSATQPLEVSFSSRPML